MSVCVCVLQDENPEYTWDMDSSSRVFVHIANADLWKQITGRDMPPTPATAEAYTRHGFQWFLHYAHGQSSLKAGKALSDIKPVGAALDVSDPEGEVQLDAETLQQLDVAQASAASHMEAAPSVDVPQSQVKHLGTKRGLEDGEW